MTQEKNIWKDFLYGIEESDKKDIENIFDELASYIKKNHLEDTDHSTYIFVIAKEVYKLIYKFDVNTFIDLYHKAYVIDTINTYKAQPDAAQYDMEACVCKSVASAIAELINDPDAGELGDIITKYINNKKENHKSYKDTFKRLRNLREFLDEGYDEIAKVIIPYVKDIFRLKNDDYIELNDEAPFSKIQFKSNSDDCLIIEKNTDNKTFDFKLYLDGNNIEFLSKSTSVLELIDLLLNLESYDYLYYYKTEYGLKELIADKLLDIQSTYTLLSKHDLNVLNKVLTQASNIGFSSNGCTTPESPTESVSNTKNQASCDKCENCKEYIEDCEYESIEPETIKDESIEPETIKDEIMMSHELNAKRQKYSKEDTLTVLEFLEDTYGNNPNYRNFLRDIRIENGLDVESKTL